MRGSVIAVLLLGLVSGCALRGAPPPAAAQEQGGTVNPALENTYWKLIQLGESPKIAGKDRQEPHLTLRPDEKRVTGTGGCNQMMGGYTLEGERLSFGRVASTMMACQQGMEQEKEFAAALEKTSRWRIVAGNLELLDDSGKTLARFEARD